jgi:hypothetical protein
MTPLEFLREEVANVREPCNRQDPMTAAALLSRGRRKVTIVATVRAAIFDFAAFTEIHIPRQLSQRGERNWDKTIWMEPDRTGIPRFSSGHDKRLTGCFYPSNSGNSHNNFPVAAPHIRMPPPAEQRYARSIQATRSAQGHR